MHAALEVKGRWRCLKGPSYSIELYQKIITCSSLVFFFLTQIMLCTHKTATILCRYIVLHYRMSHTVILPPPSTALVSQKLSRLMVTSLSMCRTKQMKHCGANQFNGSMENHLNIILLHHHHKTFESRVITSFQPPLWWEYCNWSTGQSTSHIHTGFSLEIYLQMVV